MAVVQAVSTPITDWFGLTVLDLDPLRAAICAVGEFDFAARKDLADALEHQADAGRRFVRLDLSGATFLDCSCLGVLVRAHHRFLALHGLLVLTGVDGPVARVLRLAKLDESLFVVPADEDPFGSALLARGEQLRRDLGGHVPEPREAVS